MFEQKIKRQRGFLCIAQNGNKADVFPERDYLRMAYALALSIKASQKEVPYMSVAVTPGTKIKLKHKKVFDEIIEIPWGDPAEFSKWKIRNKWKYYYCTPYEETIILDSDMLFPDDISSWWDILSQQDVWACTKPRTYRNELITSDHYRKVFTVNELPNVYTAFMYFKQSDLAAELFKLIDVIFHNWNVFYDEYLYKERPGFLSADVAYALAMKLLDVKHLCTNEHFDVPSFVHMKSQLQGWDFESLKEDWTKHVGVYLTPKGELKIGNFKQLLPFHYQVKSFLTDERIKIYEDLNSDG